MHTSESLTILILLSNIWCLSEIKRFSVLYIAKNKLSWIKLISWKQLFSSKRAFLNYKMMNECIALSPKAAKSILMRTPTYSHLSYQSELTPIHQSYNNSIIAYITIGPIYLMYIYPHSPILLLYISTVITVRYILLAMSAILH